MPAAWTDFSRPLHVRGPRATRRVVAPCLLLLALAASAACSSAAPPAASPDPGPQPAAEPPAADPPLAPPSDPTPPASADTLDAQCRARVEGPEQDGECTTDADCGTGGCSGEVCAPSAALEGLMTTCEVQPCFERLDRCGCHDGRCTWTLKPAAAGE